MDLGPTKTVRANGIEFACFERGAGPLVLLLHGFPDTPHTFAGQMTALAEAGYRAVAPFMRGYPPSSAPEDRDYRVFRLGEDALALIEALGEARAAVVGHDWGAVAGYAAANMGPERVAKLVTAAVPHVRTLAPSLGQLRRSWYMFFFQLRGIADRAVARHDFAFIDRLWRDWSPGWSFRPEDTAPVKAALAAPGGLEAALGYYRALLTSARDPRQRRAVFGKICVPTLTFAGVDDGCMGVDGFAGTPAGFTGPYELVRLSGAGHFMHRERPEAFNAKLLEFLGDPKA